MDWESFFSILLGTQTLTDILGSHYGPGIESSERNGWRKWHRADHEGVSMIEAWQPEPASSDNIPAAIQRLYESEKTTPDNLLLFFHPVPYTATFRFDRAPGRYEIDVQYFDQKNGASTFRVWVGDKEVDEWLDGDHLPATKPGCSSTRRTIPALALDPGDEIRIEGVPDGEEHAPLDYIEVHSLSN